MVLCLVLSLTGEAFAATLHIESVKAADGKYTVEGSIDDYSASSGDSLYASSYNEIGRMGGIGSSVPDAKGNWTVSGVSVASETDIVKAFVVSDKTKGLAPQSVNDRVQAVTTMNGLKNALNNADNSTIFIAKDITLSTTDTEKKIQINKNITISKGVTLTVPNAYTLQLNSGAKLTVGGTLSIAQSATIYVAGTYTAANGNRTGSAELVLGGGTVNNAGTLRVLPANTQKTDNYDGGSGGAVRGGGKGGSINSSGSILIDGGNNTMGVYNNGGSMDISDYTVTVSGTGRLQNNNWLRIAGKGVLTGTGTIDNTATLRVEGGTISGTPTLNNTHNLSLFTMYDDDGAGHISEKVPAVTTGVTLNQNNGWTYEAAQATTEAALKYALAHYTGENVELAGDSTLSVVGFDVPSGKSLRTQVPVTLTSGTVNVYGSIELYNQFAVASGAVLNVTKTGELEVQCSGNQELLNAGTITADGIIWVGKYGENKGYFRNAGTVTVGTDGGDIYVLPYSTLENNGTIDGGGNVTKISDGTGTGTVTGTVAGQKTALEVSSYSAFTSAATGSYDALFVTNGFEISSSLALGKKLIVADNAWLRILSGNTVTLSGGMNLMGWMENRGTLNIAAGTVAQLHGNFYNYGGEEKGTIVVSGTLDIYPGKLLKNNGSIKFADAGVVNIGGTLLWGSNNPIPTTGDGYTSYGTGSIVSTSRTAADINQFNTLLTDKTCENIELRFNLAITGNMTLEKSVSISSGFTLTVNSGTTLKVTNGAWLGVNNGGTLDNEGTVTVANENDNQGHVNINGGSTLTNNGNIEVFGQFNFNDREHTTINGNGSLTYHYYASLLDISKGLYSLLGSGYGLAGAADTDYNSYAGTYADWSGMKAEEKQFVGFVLKNMADRSILNKTNGDNKTYLKPYDQMTYNAVMQVLEQIWDAVNKDSSNLPTSVGLTNKAGSDRISNYNYGGGSELDKLLSSLMNAIGNTVVTSPVTYTVNSGAEQQNISFKTFEYDVTVVRDGSLSYLTDNINFNGCVFEKSIKIVNSGVRFTTNLENCTVHNYNGQAYGIYVEPDTLVNFAVTDPEAEVNISLRGTTGSVAVMAESCDAHVMSYIAGGSFKINDVQYTGASSLSADEFFEGKYQLDYGNEQNTKSYHAGQRTVKVSANGADFREFHVWDNIKNDVTLELGTVKSSGGTLNISDDKSSDEYGVIVKGTAGDQTKTSTLSMYLNGRVDISGLTSYKAEIGANSESAIRFAADGSWLSPTIVGPYSSAAIDIGSGDLTGSSYTLTLYQMSKNENGDHVLITPKGTSIHYENGRTYVYGLPNADGLVFDASYDGKTVRWDDMKRKIDNATRTEFAQALYDAYKNNAHFTSAGTAAEFVTQNGLMTDMTEGNVTMYEVVKALETIADKLGVTFKNYYKNFDLAQVDYNNNISYGTAFETKLLSMVTALALGSKYSPNIKWNNNTGKSVLTIGFDGEAPIGITATDQNGNSELSILLEAFQAACNGKIYVGDNPNIVGATFEGENTMTLGRSQWSNISFRGCSFEDKDSTTQVLNILTDCGGNVSFENGCTFTGAKSGFAVGLTPVTANHYNDENLNFSCVPGGTKFNSDHVGFNASCGTSKGTLTVNGAAVNALDFANYDGQGHALQIPLFSAGMWFDKYNENQRMPTLGVSGGVAGVTIPTNCLTKFGAISVGGDCPNEVTLNIAGGWTPNYEYGLNLRNYSNSTLKLTGSITGGTGSLESDPNTYTELDLVLTGKVDVKDAIFTGNYFILTGYFSDVDQNINLGDKNIAVIYEGVNDKNKNFVFNIGNKSGSLETATVKYFALGSEKNVTINGFTGIAMSDKYKISLGSGLTAAYKAGGYTLTLKQLNNETDIWESLNYDLDSSTDTNNYTLIPRTPLTLPFNVLLSVKHTISENDADTFNVGWSLSDLKNGEAKAKTETDLLGDLDNSQINKIYIASDITLNKKDGQPTTYVFNKDVVIKEGVTLTVAEGVTLNIAKDHGIAANGVLSVLGIVNVYGWLDGGTEWGSHVKTINAGIINTYASLEDFATELYNRYSADYGLLNSAAHDTYSGCYAADYYNGAKAEGITAINFLIENGVIPSNSTNLNGWEKQSYKQMKAKLAAMADAIETHNSSMQEIKGYEVAGLTDNDYVCNSDINSSFNTLLGSFAEKVGTITVASAVEYTPGLNNQRFSIGKTFGSDVTVNYTDVKNDFLLFANCTFNSNLIIYGGTGSGVDDIRLLNCTINGDILVKDSDGKTNVYFDGNTVSKPVITSPDVSTYDNYFFPSIPTLCWDSDGNYYDSSGGGTKNGERCASVKSYDKFVMGTLYFAKEYDARGVIKTGAAYSGPSYYSALYTGVTDITFSGNKMTIAGAKSGTYMFDSKTKFYYDDVTDVRIQNFRQIIAEDITADSDMNLSASTDKVYLMYTSNSNHTIACVYIYDT